MLAKTADFLSKVKVLTGEASAVSSPDNDGPPRNELTDDDWPSREELAAEEARLQALGVDTTSGDDGTKPREELERYVWSYHLQESLRQAVKTGDVTAEAAVEAGYDEYADVLDPSDTWRDWVEEDESSPSPSP